MASWFWRPRQPGCEPSNTGMPHCQTRDARLTCNQDHLWLLTPTSHLPVAGLLPPQAPLTTSTMTATSWYKTLCNQAPLLSTSGSGGACPPAVLPPGVFTLSLQLLVPPSPTSVTVFQPCYSTFGHGYVLNTCHAQDTGGEKGIMGLLQVTFRRVLCCF